MRFDRESFVAECRAARAEDAPQLAVRDVVERAISAPSAIEADFGIADRWRIDVLHNDDEMTIIHFI